MFLKTFSRTDEKKTRSAKTREAKLAKLLKKLPHQILGVKTVKMWFTTSNISNILLHCGKSFFMFSHNKVNCKQIKIAFSTKVLLPCSKLICYPILFVFSICKGNFCFVLGVSLTKRQKELIILLRESNNHLDERLQFISIIAMPEILWI